MTFFRATGITEYLRNGGKLQIAQQMANHESARTTGLYDGRNEFSHGAGEQLVVYPASVPVRRGPLVRILLVYNCVLSCREFCQRAIKAV